MSIIKFTSLLNFFTTILILFSGCGKGIVNEEGVTDIHENVTDIFPGVPGVVINHFPKSTKIYVGSPSLVITDDGSYIASHDVFGTSESVHKTFVFMSTDKGNNWRLQDSVGMVGGSLFYQGNALYLLGFAFGETLISKSMDDGETWNKPVDTLFRKTTALRYQKAPSPFVVHDGRIWQAMEVMAPPFGFGTQMSFMMSAPINSDLLERANWTKTNNVKYKPTWNPGESFMEGNAVVDPNGKLKNVLRVNNPHDNQAAVIPISKNGFYADSNRVDFISFPGARKKFTIRYDSVSSKYWSLTNYILPNHIGGDAGRIRNAVTLVSSPDLVNWAIDALVLYSPDDAHEGFQYIDWQVDGNDLVFVSRTAYADGMGGAHNQHDANFFTFHRIGDFRTTRTKASWLPLLEDIEDFPVAP